MIYVVQRQRSRPAVVKWAAEEKNKRSSSGMSVYEKSDNIVACIPMYHTIELRPPRIYRYKTLPCSAMRKGCAAVALSGSNPTHAYGLVT
jgi:hypothetical protein